MKSPEIVIIICSNRLSNLRSYLPINRENLIPASRMVAIIDLESSSEVINCAESFRAQGVECILNGCNLGLSASRNLALRVFPESFLLFIDDDVVIPTKTLEAICECMNQGAEVIGTKIIEPEKWIPAKWYLGKGQLHYLAIHAGPSFSTWGACMGIDASFAARNGLAFRLDLGRKGSKLESGDDTTFIRRMKQLGARESFLDQVFVLHYISPERISFLYLVRRAFWQGRSECRRGDCIIGVKKEWGRLYRYATNLRSLVTALLFMQIVILGVVFECTIMSFLKCRKLSFFALQT